MGFDFICYSGDVWVLHDALADAIRGSATLAAQRRSHDCVVTGGALGRFSQARRLADLFRTRSRPAPDAAGVEIEFLEPSDPIRAEQIANFDALILLAPRFTAQSIHPNGRLAVVARFGVGYDTVEIEACTNAGIALVTTPDGVRRPVAVAIVALMLALTGRLMAKDRLTREAAAVSIAATNAWGSGSSAGRSARSASAISARSCSGWRALRHALHRARSLCRREDFAPLGVEPVGLEDVFRRADVVSVGCPLYPATRHLVNAERLALMKPTAYLINTARGPIVDQAALTRVLQQRRIAGAGLDVLDREPPEPNRSDPDARQRDLHAARPISTDQCFAGNGAADVKAVIDVQHGREPRFVVNQALLAGERWRQRMADLRGRFGRGPGLQNPLPESETEGWERVEK